MKKTMILLLVSILVYLTTGCKKHTEIEPEPNPIDLSLKVGNIYCDDGSAIDPYNYKQLGMTNAVGVIFWVNDSLEVEDKAYIVSLKDAELYGQHLCSWSDTLVSTGVSTSISALDGAANTTKIVSFQLENGGYFMAKDFATSYHEGDFKSWYLPSAAQLIQLYLNMEPVTYALECCSGEDFSRVWYWTSTEDNDGSESKKYNACIVSLEEGHIQASLKTNFHNVRPIKTIK